MPVSHPYDKGLLYLRGVRLAADTLFATEGVCTERRTRCVCTRPTNSRCTVVTLPGN